jgi:hypothetical protein
MVQLMRPKERDMSGIYSDLEAWCDQQGLVLKDFPDDLVELAVNQGPGHLENWLAEHEPLTQVQVETP